MPAPTAETSGDLPCHQCGYDLRAHPHDGKCPECEASVAESVRVTAIPGRPSWRNSDPRWRRRVLAGTWTLVLLPLVDMLNTLGWAKNVPVPTVFDYRHTVRTLDDTLLCSGMDVYEPLVFCIGVALLCSNERGRRPSTLDWTRRWGVLCSYVVLLLSAAQVLFIVALVLLGIAALLQSMPPKYQPGTTELFVDVSTANLRYGPHPQEIASLVLVAFSSIAILLACVPLFDALRSSGRKAFAAVLLVPLALFALVYVAQVGWSIVSDPRVGSQELFGYQTYFWPELLIATFTGRQTDWSASGSVVSPLVETTKWCVLFVTAVWLTAGLLLTRWRGRKTPAA
ncbi:MAG TPA: hypothetical protein VGN72_03225 [Tepidisphaeraceae bacterium]|jgi:hypothetical protein|nr:hypothetical protein [Tepidisphaeraceae bacterium]